VQYKKLLSSTSTSFNSTFSTILLPQRRSSTSKNLEFEARIAIVEARIATNLEVGNSNQNRNIN